MTYYVKTVHLPLAPTRMDDPDQPIFDFQWAIHSMASARVCHGPERISSISVPRRGRSRLQHRKRQSTDAYHTQGIRRRNSRYRKVSFDANGVAHSLNLEPNFQREKENSETLENRSSQAIKETLDIGINSGTDSETRENPSLQAIIQTLENEINAGTEVKSSVSAPNSWFNWTDWESHMHLKIEPTKFAISELKFLLGEGLSDPMSNKRCRLRNSVRKSTAPTKKGTRFSPYSNRPREIDLQKVSCPLDVFQSESSNTCEAPFSEKKLDLQKLCSWFGNLQSENDNTCEDPGSEKNVSESTITCEALLNAGDSFEVIDINGCKDPESIMVIILLLDVDIGQGKTCKRRSRRKKSEKKAVRLSYANDGPKLDKYLDTNIIDRYMEQLWKKLPKDKQESCTYLDCLWFSMYLEEALSFNVLKWTKAKRIFSKRYVFIPIVHWSHWNLLILCHFGEDFSSQTRTPCMLLLDSLKETEPKRLEPLIRKFIMEVYREEGRQESDKTISSIPLLVPDVPQQTNGNDCGVFLLHFVDLFLKCAPENFSTFEGYPYFLTKNWFKTRDIGKRRKHILDVFSSGGDYVSNKRNRRISTRSRKLHSLVNSDSCSNWIDLSSAA
eukprot:Gb_17992 [translate_table: standard]